MRKRVEMSQQYYDFELKEEMFFNENMDEIVSTRNYAYKPSYLEITRSTQENILRVF